MEKINPIFKKKGVFIYLIILFSFVNQSYSKNIIVMPSEEDIKSQKNKIQELNFEIIPLPELNVEPKYNIPVFLRNQSKDQGKLLEKKVIGTAKDSVLLDSKEFSSFEIDTKAGTIKSIKPVINLTQTALDALKQSPNWLEDQLLLKFRKLSKTNHLDKFAQLIIDAPQNIKDEVAFTIAYMSVETMTNSRFLKDINVIIRNAEMIYKVADSLQYVQLVEKGTVATRDFYTTTKYRVYDRTKNDTIWSEIPRDIYYFYIVHPKLDQEGVFVADDASVNEQRTYGYIWRDFLWSNPDSLNNYTKVNITTTKGTVSTIPTLSELMKKSKVLWDRNQTYLPFNRPFSDKDNALDALGNWASKALPVNVTLPRSFQPNQIIMKHNGMCNEDAFLVAGACRTALIPIIYLGTWNEDHVFGSIYDNDWYHFEFFRGGLEPTGNQAYGITNMMKGGSYGWTNSMVEGFRPDGYSINFTNYYAKTCSFNVSVVDKNGKPVEGAMLQIYAAPSAYSQNPGMSGRIFTDFNGKATFVTGAGKKYFVRIYHPTLNWAPVESNKLYYLSPQSGNAAEGAIYNVTIPFSDVSIASSIPDSLSLPEQAQYTVNLKWNVVDILTGINQHDSQRSRFYKWNDKNEGEISFFVVDSSNYQAFSKKLPFSAYSYNGFTKGGDINIPLPTEGKWYTVFSNHNFVNFLQNLNADISLSYDPTIGIKEQVIKNDLEINLTTFDNYLTVKSNANIYKFEVYNLLGKLIEFGNLNNNMIDISNMKPGLYLVKFTTLDNRIISSKFLKNN